VEGKDDKCLSNLKGDTLDRQMDIIAEILIRSFEMMHGIKAGGQNWTEVSGDFIEWHAGNCIQKKHEKES